VPFSEAPVSDSDVHNDVVTRPIEGNSSDCDTDAREAEVRNAVATTSPPPQTIAALASPPAAKKRTRSIRNWTQPKLAQTCTAPVTPVEPPAVATEPSPSSEAAGVSASTPVSVESINAHALNREILLDPGVTSRVRREAVALRDVVFPSDFVRAAGLDQEVSDVGARLHLLQFREAAGATTDPVEQLLLDVLSLARVRVARVHALAEHAKSPELIKTYLNTGCRLMSEIAKTVLALSAYRSESRASALATKTPNIELASKPEGLSQ